jgi:hypothetical protein
MSAVLAQPEGAENKIRHPGRTTPADSLFNGMA